MSIYRLFNYNEVQGHFITNEVTNQKLHNTVNMCNKGVNGFHLLMSWYVFNGVKHGISIPFNTLSLQYMRIRRSQDSRPLTCICFSMLPIVQSECRPFPHYKCAIEVSFLFSAFVASITSRSRLQLEKGWNIRFIYLTWIYSNALF